MRSSLAKTPLKAVTDAGFIVGGSDAAMRKVHMKNLATTSTFDHDHTICTRFSNLSVVDLFLIQKFCYGMLR